MRQRLALIFTFTFAAISAPALAQSGGAAPVDVSPVLLLESVASDNPEYRRMVFVKYLTGDQVSAAYKAYNRAEFITLPGANASETARDCAGGPATNFKVIQAFERTEARRARNDLAVEPTVFCIKGVTGWESQGNRTKYLDPIFNGMPHAATLK